MSSKIILSGTTFSPASDIKYSNPKLDFRGGKSVGILNTSDNSIIYISTPLMLTWGISYYDGYEMAIQFPDTEYATHDISDFMSNMIDLETKIKTDAIENAKEWFDKANMREDDIDALWTPMLKYPKHKNDLDQTCSPTLNIKIPYWDNAWKTELYDVNQRVIFPDPDGCYITPKDLITKGTYVALVIQCDGLWFSNHKFGITWKLFQGVVTPRCC